MDRILVVVPTYNEKDNIVELCNSLLDVRPGLDVLVVDDASPDGTSQIVGGHPQFGSRVFLIERSGKAGRGSATIAGFKFGLDKGGYDYIVEMDADFSHHPNDLPAILAKVPDNDLVVGSRYIKGSKIVGWNLRDGCSASWQTCMPASCSKCRYATTPTATVVIGQASCRACRLIVSNPAGT